MLTLSLKQTSSIPLEVETLLPEWLASKAIVEIERLPIAHGNRSEPLAEWFDVTGDASDSVIAFQGDCGNVKRIGERMTTGQIIVEGNAGLHAGAMMKGGGLEIRGHAGDWLGAEMTGGTIRVRGDAKNQAGAAYRGSRIGMSGGTIIIHGNAGDELGLLMRRGFIAVGGTAGAYCGASMIAGTIAVSNGVGQRIGAGMKRGTIIVRGPEPEWHAGTAFACTFQPAYASLIMPRIYGMEIHEGARQPPQECFDFRSGILANGRCKPAGESPALTGRLTPAVRQNETIRCHRADLITGGRGEIWHLPAN